MARANLAMVRLSVGQSREKEPKSRGVECAVVGMVAANGYGRQNGRRQGQRADNSKTFFWLPRRKSTETAFDAQFREGLFGYHVGFGEAHAGMVVRPLMAVYHAASARLVSRIDSHILSAHEEDRLSILWSLECVAWISGAIGAGRPAAVDRARCGG